MIDNYTTHVATKLFGWDIDSNKKIISFHKKIRKIILKKKAYILAFQKATNYGAVLQIYALKTTLEKLGLVVEVIDYVPQWMQVTMKNQPHFKSYIKRKIMNFTFRKFFNNLNLTQQTFYDLESLKNNLKDGDYYFVGSDQVWNPKIMKNDTTYFLDFVPKAAKKIGYAISMGNQELSNQFRQVVIPLIESFDSLSGRENYVSNFIHQYYPEYNVPVVLDPTLLLNKEEYMNVKDTKQFTSDFIVVYGAMHDENLYNYSKYLKQKTGLQLVNLGYHFKGADKHEYLLGPENWLNRIAQAKYFITNSFHGTVFSILFKKDFLVVPNQKEPALNARFMELLESLDMNSRLVYSINDIDKIIDSKLNFKNSYQLLEERRKQSINYIKEAIEDES